jgi:hypothetical protein
MILSTTCESPLVSFAYADGSKVSCLVSPDEYEDYQSPASAASSFLLTMATGRTKTTFIPILGLAQSVLTGGEYVSICYHLAESALNIALVQWNDPGTEVWCIKHHSQLIFDDHASSRG